MAADPADIFELLKLMRMDMSQLQARLTDLQNMVANLNLTSPEQWACERCGVAFPNRLEMLDHLAGIHQDGEAEVERERLWADLEKLAAQ